MLNWLGVFSDRLKKRVLRHGLGSKGGGGGGLRHGSGQNNNNNNNIALVIAPHILVASSRALYIITLTSTCFIPTHTSTPRGAYSTCSHI